MESEVAVGAPFTAIESDQKWPVRDQLGEGDFFPESVGEAKRRKAVANLDCLRRLKFFLEVLIDFDNGACYV